MIHMMTTLRLWWSVGDLGPAVLFAVGVRMPVRLHGVSEQELYGSIPQLHIAAVWRMVAVSRLSRTLPNKNLAAELRALCIVGCDSGCSLEGI
jgi:hypothetical protein